MREGGEKRGGGAQQSGSFHLLVFLSHFHRLLVVFRSHRGLCGLGGERPAIIWWWWLYANPALLRGLPTAVKWYAEERWTSVPPPTLLCCVTSHWPVISFICPEAIGRVIVWITADWFDSCVPNVCQSLFCSAPRTHLPVVARCCGRCDRPPAGRLGHYYYYYYYYDQRCSLPPLSLCSFSPPPEVHSPCCAAMRAGCAARVCARSDAKRRGATTGHACLQRDREDAARQVGCGGVVHPLPRSVPAGRAHRPRHLI